MADTSTITVVLAAAAQLTEMLAAMLQALDIKFIPQLVVRVQMLFLEKMQPTMAKAVAVVTAAVVAVVVHLYIITTRSARPK